MDGEDRETVFLAERRQNLFGVRYDVLLYDLTSIYSQGDPPLAEGDKRRHSYSRDHRPDCVQVVTAPIVTLEGLPLAYEVLPGNTADNTTLPGFLAQMRQREINYLVATRQYGWRQYGP